MSARNVVETLLSRRNSCFSCDGPEEVRVARALELGRRARTTASMVVSVDVPARTAALGAPQTLVNRCGWGYLHLVSPIGEQV